MHARKILATSAAGCLLVLGTMGPAMADNSVISIAKTGTMSATHKIAYLRMVVTCSEDTTSGYISGTLHPGHLRRHPDGDVGGLRAERGRVHRRGGAGHPPGPPAHGRLQVGQGLGSRLEPVLRDDGPVRHLQGQHQGTYRHPEVAPGRRPRQADAGAFPDGPEPARSEPIEGSRESVRIGPAKGGRNFAVVQLAMAQTCHVRAMDGPFSGARICHAQRYCSPTAG